MRNLQTVRCCLHVHVCRKRQKWKGQIEMATTPMLSNQLECKEYVLQLSEKCLQQFVKGKTCTLDMPWKLLKVKPAVLLATCHRKQAVSTQWAPSQTLATTLYKHHTVCTRLATTLYKHHTVCTCIKEGFWYSLHPNFASSFYSNFFLSTRN